MCETLNLHIRLYLRELRTPPMPNFLIGLDFIIWSTDTRLQVLWAKLPKIWGEISFMDIKKIKNVNYTSWVYICIIYLHILIYFMIFLYFREYRECPRCPPLAHRPIRMYILLYLIYTYAGQIKQHACTRTSGVTYMADYALTRACMHARTYAAKLLAFVRAAHVRAYWRTPHHGRPWAGDVVYVRLFSSALICMHDCHAWAWAAAHAYRSDVRRRHPTTATVLLLNPIFIYTRSELSIGFVICLTQRWYIRWNMQGRYIQTWLVS